MTNQSVAKTRFSVRYDFQISVAFACRKERAPADEGSNQGDGWQIVAERKQRPLG